MNEQINTLQNTNSQETTKKPSKTKEKKKPSGLLVLIIIIIVTVAFTSYAYFIENNSSSFSIQNKTTNNSDNKNNLFNFSINPSKKTEAPSEDYIAKIYITGVIQNSNKTYNQEWLLNTIETLKEDKNNKGILLYIDSPGGSVYESDEIYLALNNYQKSRKPVWAYMGPLAASGGYYISCGAEYICANRNTLTGSIGVISGESLDLTQMLDKLGIKSKTFTAGKNKNMLNYNTPLTEEHEQIMQSIADECYDQFTSIVAINRKIDIDRVREIADGRIYTAKQALNLNLVDKICSEEEAISAMKAKYKFTDTKVIDYTYVQKINWMDYLYSFVSNIKPLSQSTESKVIDMLDKDLTYPAYIYK